MHKLKLTIEDLQIESFTTATTERQRGTVAAAAATALGEATCVVCTRLNCGVPSEPGYATYVNGVCIRC